VAESLGEKSKDDVSFRRDSDILDRGKWPGFFWGFDNGISPVFLGTVRSNRSVCRTGHAFPNLAAFVDGSCSYWGLVTDVQLYRFDIYQPSSAE